MNKIYKYCAAAFAGLLALTLGSCTNEYEYDAAVAEGQQVYFSSSLASKVELSYDASSFNVPINRVKTDGALSVNLTLTDESGLFTAPSSVSFAAGESSTNVAISYDPDKFQYDDFKNLVLTITDADYTTPYGASTYSFSAGVPSPWTSLGVGTYLDQFFMSEAVEVEIQQNDLNKSQFRLVNPYGEIASLYGEADYATTGEESEYMELTVMQAGQSLVGVTLTQSDLVYFSTVNSGIDAGGYGTAISLYHPSNFQSLASEDKWTASHVLAYQDNGLPGIINIGPVYYMSGVGGWTSYYLTEGMVQIVFPGYDVKDYSASVSYTGAFIDTSDNTYAMGSIKLGADVEEAQVAVIEGTNVESAINDVLNGVIETTTITESGDVKIECPYSGECTMIAITYADGEAQNYGYATFNFNVGGSDWKSLGTGLYTDYVLASFLSYSDGTTADPIQYEVEVQESKTTPGLYRILHPYAPDTYGYGDLGGYDEAGTYNVIINATDPAHVYIDPQATGFSDSEYGDILILTLGGLYINYSGQTYDYLANNGYVNGTLSNGVITFPEHELLYAYSSEVAQGYAGYVYAGATSVLTLPSAVSAKAKARAKAAKKNAAAVTMKKSPSSKSAKRLDANLRFKMAKRMDAPIGFKLK